LYGGAASEIRRERVKVENRWEDGLCEAMIYAEWRIRRKMVGESSRVVCTEYGWQGRTRVLIYVYMRIEDGEKMVGMWEWSVAKGGEALGWKTSGEGMV
jgi:hypothetical protein